MPQYVSAIDVTKFDVLWTYFVEPTPPAGLKHNASPIVADLTGNGIGDVFVVSANGSILGLRGKTGYPAGELLWKTQLPETKRMISSPAAYDFDKDGLLDFVIATEDGKIIVVKSNTRRKEFEILADIKASNTPITSSPLIADIFGIGKLQILFANSMDALQIVETDAKSLQILLFIYVPWWSEHTGFEGLGKYKTNYMKKLIIGVVILIVFLFIRVRFAVSRNAKRLRFSSYENFTLC